MNARRALISEALRARYTQVCKEAEALQPDNFRDAEAFVAQTRRFVLDKSTEGNYTAWTVPAVWFHFESSCLSSIRQLVTSEQMAASECLEPPGAQFLQTLQGNSRNASQRFQLLTARYAHPLNFCAPSEALVREHVLERLMVQDRARIEGGSQLQLDIDDFFLRLNLIAIHAATTSDLRFIDALNYHYELLSSLSDPQYRQTWLFVSFLALYARALRIRLEEIA